MGLKFDAENGVSVPFRGARKNLHAVNNLLFLQSPVDRYYDIGF